MNLIFRRSLIALVIFFSLVLTLQAQDIKNKKKEVELEGSCPVAYLMMNKDMKGDSKFASTHNNKTYYFANADAKKMFDMAPEKYLPKYDGYCATAVAMGERIVSDHQYFSVYEGATYLFSNQMAKESFDKDSKMIITKADKNYASLKK